MNETVSNAKIEPSNKDVLLGRGGLTNKHPGNIRYRHLVMMNTKAYMQCKEKAYKQLYAKSIVMAISGSSSLDRTIANNKSKQPKGGRFLQLNKKTNQFEQISEKSAIEKTKQALRDRSVIFSAKKAMKKNKKSSSKAQLSSKQWQHVAFSSRTNTMTTTSTASVAPPKTGPTSIVSVASSEFDDEGTNHSNRLMATDDSSILEYEPISVQFPPALEYKLPNVMPGEGSIDVPANEHQMKIASKDISKMVYDRLSPSPGPSIERGDVVRENNVVDASDFLGTCIDDSVPRHSRIDTAEESLDNLLQWIFGDAGDCSENIFHDVVGEGVAINSDINLTG